MKYDFRKYNCQKELQIEIPGLRDSVYLYESPQGTGKCEDNCTRQDIERKSLKFCFIYR